MGVNSTRVDPTVAAKNPQAMMIVSLAGVGWMDRKTMGKVMAQTNTIRKSADEDQNGQKRIRRRRRVISLEDRHDSLLLLDRRHSVLGLLMHDRVRGRKYASLY